jgi:hypothetical protein
MTCEHITTSDYGRAVSGSAVATLEKECPWCRVAELEATFALRWHADQRAIKRWQAEDPKARELVWPDHADMVVGLLKALDDAQLAYRLAFERADKAEGKLNHTAVERDLARKERDNLSCRLEERSNQLPPEMQDCTIRFIACEKGHGRLTATNWIDPGCQQCRLDAIREIVIHEPGGNRAVDRIWQMLKGESVVERQSNNG